MSKVCTISNKKKNSSKHNVFYFAENAQFNVWVLHTWSKVVQHATTSNEGNQRPKYLQNYDEKLDMG